MVDDALVILLAGGAGERLCPAHERPRQTSRVLRRPYASSISRSATASTQDCAASSSRRDKSLSLNRHIRMGWSIVSEELGEFVEILPPQKRVSEHWYQGTADAVYQNLYSIVQENPITSSCSRAITSTRWTTRRCCASTRSGAPP